MHYEVRKRAPKVSLQHKGVRNYLGKIKAVTKKGRESVNHPSFPKDLTALPKIPSRYPINILIAFLAVQLMVQSPLENISLNRHTSNQVSYMLGC